MLGPIAGDIDSVSFLIDRLNEFLGGAVQKRASQLLDAKMAGDVAQMFLSLETMWSATPGFSLDAIRDLDPAEAFAVNFFAPLLDPSALRDALLSGNTGYVTANPFTTAVAQAYSPFFTQLESILAAAGFSHSLSQLVLGLEIGLVSLCSFPLWVVYRQLHGYATYARIVPRVTVSIAAGAGLLDDGRSAVLAAAPANVAALDQVLAQLHASLRQALAQKADAYLQAFEANAEGIFRIRSRQREKDLNSAVDSLQFWKNVSGAKTSISLGAKGLDPGDQVLPYLGGVYLNANETTQDRSFYAVADGWAALQQAARFVSQAGFWLYLNAANNPYGGRHPPHTTHENGGDFDLGWTYLSTTHNPDQVIDPHDARNHREDLARMEKVQPQRGYPIFSDPVTRTDYTLIPIPADKDKPPTHAQMQRLAVHVVLQAVALCGLRRYLYADAQNMRFAATNLGGALTCLARQVGANVPPIDPWSGAQKAVIAVTEAISHYNHVHGELFARGTSDLGTLFRDPRLTAVLTFLYELALERDADDDFFAQMFRPRAGVQRDESEARIGPFRNAWKSRSAAGMPSLLPVWLTKKRFEQIYGLG